MTTSTIHRGAGPRARREIRPPATAPTPLQIRPGRYASTHRATMRDVGARAAAILATIAVVVGVLAMTGSADMRQTCRDAHVFGNASDAATRGTCRDLFGPRGY